MLLYNKALDVNHTMLRFVSILVHLEPQGIEHDRLRILDFIVANPSYITKIHIDKENIKARNTFRSYENSYQNYDPHRLFESMNPIQELVVYKLIELGVLTKTASEKNYNVNNEKIPALLHELSLSESNSISHQVIKFIREHLTNISLTGPNGLKYISKLMEYRYDVV